MLEVILISVGLAMDSFAASIGCACTKKPGVSEGLFMAGSFGFFQGFMALVGWILGSGLAGVIEAYDHWVAFVLLLFVGGKMIFEYFEDEETRCAKNPFCGPNVFALSVGTSIDAMVIGVSFSLLGEEILVPSLLIGITAFLFSVFGVFCAGKLRRFIGRKAEVAGGIILVLLGVRILVEHLGVFA